VFGERLGELRLQATFAGKLIRKLLELVRRALDSLIGRRHFFLIGGSSPVGVRQMRLAVGREAMVGSAPGAPVQPVQGRVRSMVGFSTNPAASETLHTYARFMQLGKPERHRLIESVVSRKRVGTQFELLDALGEAGCAVTQATISRDIRELRLEKTHDQFG